MSVYNKNNKFISYLIILATLFILMLFTKDEIMQVQENNDMKEVYNNDLEVKLTKLLELNKLKSELVNSSKDISKYNLEIKEDELINYIYSYIESTNKNNEIAIVKNISIGDSIDTEIGFKKIILNLNLIVPNEQKLKNILNFLTSSNSKYNFFITSFSFPYGEKSDGSFNVSIPLEILYK